jgi:hypothetical protein
MAVVISLKRAIVSARREEEKMRMRPLSICLLSGVIPCLFASGGAFAQQQSDTTPVYDFGEVGGVIVYDNTPMGYAQQPGGRGVVQQNDYDQAGEYWFYGPHPDGQGGWDPTEGAHSHDYPPFDSYLFTQENGYFYFIGDPADFGYANNDLYNYYGEHPIPIADGGGYCYYSGYHHHFWPAFGGYFAITDGWYLYNGPFSPWFWQYRDRYTNYFRNSYPNVRVHYGQPPQVHYGQPPAPPRVPRFLTPVQRMRSPVAPARAGWGYTAPVRPVMVRSAMPPRPIHGAPARLAPAPARVVPARGAPVRAAPAGGTRRH